MGAAASSNVKKNGLELGFGLLAKAGVKFVHVFGAIIVFLVLWEIAPDLGLINEVIIPTPTTIFDKFVQTILSGELLTHVGISMQRILLGFGIALAVALPLGFLLGGWFKTLETAVNPLLQVLSQANPFTLFPVFITLLGIGEISKISIIFWVCQWPVLFNTVTGIKNVDPALVKMARSLGMSKFQMFYKVLLPGAMPSVFTGIRMSAVFAFFMLIGAEMIGASSGLGYMILQAQATFQMPKMWVGIVTVALLGILVNLLIQYLEKRLSGWKEAITI
ncbi:ABC transporter permease [Methanomassiliicoccus luminyensis]|uniref:ABC transporter permease n=1 Tax=Methanomassiliicoccus luminyensis TaxID=1080712 RepID=UPI00035F4AF6|nr:ABC transporter permease [Methanomassiliicoccus luminyensis]